MQRIIPFTGKLSATESQLWIDALQKAMPQYKVLALRELSAIHAQSVEVAIVANPDSRELAKLHNLKWIHSVWAGVEGLLQGDISRKIDIVRLVDPNLAQAMSEAVLAATMYVHRDMPLYLAQQSKSFWHQSDVRLAKNRRIGILGLGELGLKVGECLIKNDFQVCGWSRRAKNTSALGINSMHGQAGLDSILHNSEILIILLPLTPDTTGLLNESTLAKLPRGASVINFARGPIVVEEALLKHLKTGHINHAVLDVFDHEPLPSDHPYWSNKHITVWPHISTPTNVNSAAAIVGKNVRAYYENNLLPKTADRARQY